VDSKLEKNVDIKLEKNVNTNTRLVMINFMCIFTNPFSLKNLRVKLFFPICKTPAHKQGAN